MHASKNQQPCADGAACAPHPLPQLPNQQKPAATATALSMETFEALAKKHVTDIISYVERHRDLRDETEDALTEAVITEISRGKVSVNDIFQSFDEVLEDEFAGFYEALEAAQETDKATLQHELAASVEAYA